MSRVSIWIEGNVRMDVWICVWIDEQTDGLTKMHAYTKSDKEQVEKMIQSFTMNKTNNTLEQTSNDDGLRDI